MLQTALSNLEIELPEFTKEAKQKPAPRKWSEEAIDETGYIGEALKVFLCHGDPARLKSSANPYKIIMRGMSKELWFVRKSQWTKSGWNRSLLAKEINGEVFGNSSVIFGGRRAEIQNRRDRRTGNQFGRAGELNCQRVVNRYLPMIPLVLFKESKLDIEKLVVVEKGPEGHHDFGRTDKNNRPVLQHFTGALLFNIDDTQFLADLDQNEIKMKKMNFWMSKLPKKCSSIAEAYASLKPKEVAEAEKFMGKECPRQGEWFFIPVSGSFKGDASKQTESQGWGSNRQTVAVLQAKGNRAHYVSEMSLEGYVKGRVTHGGYEHEPINLKGWHKPIPNTAVESYKISGMVD